MYNNPGKELVTCPYNAAHRVVRHRFQNHLLKCQKSYTEVELMTCCYNFTHRVKADKMTAHLEECPDKIRLEGSRYNDRDEALLLPSLAKNRSFTENKTENGKESTKDAGSDLACSSTFSGQSRMTMRSNALMKNGPRGNTSRYAMGRKKYELHGIEEGFLREYDCVAEAQDEIPQKRLESMFSDKEPNDVKSFSSETKCRKKIPHMATNSESSDDEEEEKLLNQEIVKTTLRTNEMFSTEYDDNLHLMENSKSEVDYDQFFEDCESILSPMALSQCSSLENVRNQRYAGTNSSQDGEFMKNFVSGFLNRGGRISKSYKPDKQFQLNIKSLKCSEKKSVSDGQIGTSSGGSVASKKNHNQEFQRKRGLSRGRFMEGVDRDSIQSCEKALSRGRGLMPTTTKFPLFHPSKGRGYVLENF